MNIDICVIYIYMLYVIIYVCLLTKLVFCWGPRYSYTKTPIVISVVWCETAQSVELGFGSVHRRIPTVEESWEQQTTGWSSPIPAPTYSFSSSSWVTDGRTCWPKLLKRRGDRGAKVEKNWQIYWMKSKACLFIWGRSGSNFFSLIADKCALRRVWLFSSDLVTQS